MNCAGYTAVDRAESDTEQAFRVNATGAEYIGAACAEAGVPLIHLSTDYVFDGEKSRPWREDDPASPLSVYGKSKLEGELAIRRVHPSHIILRTSWIFSAHGENFVKTILRIADERRQLHVVADQIGGPTAADDLAVAILSIAAAIAKPGFATWGTYHFCGAPPASWYEFARSILENRNTEVLPIASKNYARPAPRPANSVLDCERILRVFAIAQPDWRASLRKVLREIEVERTDA
jgi:dTDP-4-dehydrorhamnose reductase